MKRLCTAKGGKDTFLLFTVLDIFFFSSLEFDVLVWHGLQSSMQTLIITNVLPRLYLGRIKSPSNMKYHCLWWLLWNWWKSITHNKTGMFDQTKLIDAVFDHLWKSDPRSFLKFASGYQRLCHLTPQLTKKLVHVNANNISWLITLQGNKVGP